jgi:hypothetical protein
MSDTISENIFGVINEKVYWKDYKILAFLVQRGLRYRSMWLKIGIARQI